MGGGIPGDMYLACPTWTHGTDPGLGMPPISPEGLEG